MANIGSAFTAGLQAGGQASGIGNAISQLAESLRQKRQQEQAMAFRQQQAVQEQAFRGSESAKNRQLQAASQGLIQTPDGGFRQRTPQEELEMIAAKIGAAQDFMRGGPQGATGLGMGSGQTRQDAQPPVVRQPPPQTQASPKQQPSAKSPQERRPNILELIPAGPSDQEKRLSQVIPEIEESLEGAKTERGTLKTEELQGKIDELNSFIADTKKGSGVYKELKKQKERAEAELSMHLSGYTSSFDDEKKKIATLEEKKRVAEAELSRLEAEREADTAQKVEQIKKLFGGDEKTANAVTDISAREGVDPEVGAEAVKKMNDAFDIRAAGGAKVAADQLESDAASMFGGNVDLVKSLAMEVYLKKEGLDLGGGGEAPSPTAIFNGAVQLRKGVSPGSPKAKRLDSFLYSFIPQIEDTTPVDESSANPRIAAMVNAKLNSRTIDQFTEEINGSTTMTPEQRQEAIKLFTSKKLAMRDNAR